MLLKSKIQFSSPVYNEPVIRRLGALVFVQSERLAGRGMRSRSLQSLRIPLALHEPRSLEFSNKQPVGPRAEEGDQLRHKPTLPKEETPKLLRTIPRN